MQATRFVEAYRDTPYSQDREKRARGERKDAYRFGRLVMNVAEIVDSDIDDPRLYGELQQWHQEGIRRYESHMQQIAPTLGHRVSQLLHSSQRILRPEYYNDASYRLRNIAALGQWSLFAETGFAGQSPSEAVLKRMRRELLMGSLTMVMATNAMLNHEGYTLDDYRDEKTPLSRGWIEGAINEIDAGIVLASASLADPENRWWVLPAPPQFDMGMAHDRNIDWVIIDMQQRKMIGAQVKSKGKHLSEYDWRYSIGIDGMRDLGNQTWPRGNNIGRLTSMAGRYSCQVLQADGHDAAHRFLYQSVPRERVAELSESKPPLRKVERVTAEIRERIALAL